jgi:hypothetical protein
MIFFSFHNYVEAQENPIVTVVATAEEGEGNSYIEVKYILRETSVIQIDKIEIIDQDVNFYELKEEDISDSDLVGDIGYTETSGPSTKTLKWYYESALTDKDISGKLKVKIFLSAKSSQPASIKMYLGDVMPQYENQSGPVILRNSEGPTDDFEPYTGLSSLGNWHSTLPDDAKFYGIGSVTDFPLYRHSSSNFHGRPTLPSGSSFFAFKDNENSRQIWINAAAGKMQGVPGAKKLTDFQIHYTGDEESGTAIVGIARDGESDLISTSTTDATLELEYLSSDAVASNEVEIVKKPALKLLVTADNNYIEEPVAPEDSILFNIKVDEPDDEGNFSPAEGVKLFVRNEVNKDIQFVEFAKKTDSNGELEYLYIIPEDTEYGLYSIELYAETDDKDALKSTIVKTVIKVAPEPDIVITSSEESYEVLQEETVEITLTVRDKEGEIVEDARVLVVNPILQPGYEEYLGKTDAAGKLTYKYPIPKDTKDSAYEFTFYANEKKDESQKSKPLKVRVIVGDIPILLIAITPNTDYKLKPTESEKIDITITEEIEGETVPVEDAQIYIQDGLNGDKSFRPLGATDANGVRKYDILVPEDKEQDEYEIKFYATKDEYVDSKESIVKVNVSVDSCWNEGSFEFCTKSGWDEKEDDPVIKANGEVLINNLISFSGTMEINKETLKLKANGTFSIKDVPLPGGGNGNITLMSGNLVDVELLGSNGSFTNLLNQSLSNAPKICGVKIEKISDIKLIGGTNASGVEISASIKIPGFAPGCDKDGKKPVDTGIKVTGLKIQRNTGMYFDGFEVSNLSPAPKFCLNQLTYNYDQKIDKLDLGAEFTVPFMKVGAGASFREAKLDSVGFKATLAKGIPIGNTGVCVLGLEGKAHGLAFPPLELTFGGTVNNCLNKDLMEITARVGYKAPSTLYINGDAKFIKLPSTTYWQITGSPEIRFDYNNALLKLTSSLKCGTFDGKAYVLNGSFDMGYKADVGKFTGKVNGSLTLPKLPFKGFPYDIIEARLKLPYTTSMNAFVNMSENTRHIYTECDFANLGKFNFQLDLTKASNDTEFFTYNKGKQYIPSIAFNGKKSNSVNSTQADIEKSINIPSNSEWMYVRIYSEDQAPESKLIMPDNTELTGPDEGANILHFNSEDGLTSFWSVEAPMEGDWKIILLDGSEEDIVEVYLTEGETPFTVTATQVDNEVTLSWNPDSFESTDFIEFYLDDNDDGYDGYRFAEIRATDAEYIFTMTDTLGYCNNYIYAFVQSDSEDLLATGYADAPVTNEKTSLPPPHDMTAVYYTTGKLMTVEWMPNNMANVAGYYVIVTDKDGKDSTYAIAYANDTKVEFNLEDNEGITIRMAAIDEDYRSGCPSAPIDIITDVETEPITGLVFDESRIAIVPNPVTDETNISFKLNNNSYVKLGIYDMYGNRIAVLAEGYYQTGVIKNNWNSQGQAAGTYLVKFEAEDIYTTQKLILIK